MTHSVRVAIARMRHKIIRRHRRVRWSADNDRRGEAGAHRESTQRGISGGLNEFRVVKGEGKELW